MTTVTAAAPDIATSRPGRRWRRTVGGEGAKVVLPLVAAVVAISLYTNHENSNFLTWANIENIGVQASVLAIVAIGQTFVIAAGQLDLSVGSMTSFVGVLAATWLTDGRPDIVVIGLAVLVGMACGAAWGVLVALVRIPPFILTLGGLSVLSSFALQRAGDRPVPARDGLEWLRTGEFVGLRWPIVVTFVVVVIATFVLRYTGFGRGVYAVGSSEEASHLAGLPVKRTKILVFMISGALVGIAAIVLVTRLGAGDPRGGAGLELRAIAAVVLGGATLAGGRGSAIGTAIGVVLLGVIQTSLTFLKVDASFEGLVFGGVLIVAVALTAIIDHRRGTPPPWRTLLGRGASRPAADVPDMVAATGPLLSTDTATQRPPTTDDHDVTEGATP